MSSAQRESPSRGGSAAGVRGMDAEPEPTGTYSRRPLHSPRAAATDRSHNSPLAKGEDSATPLRCAQNDAEAKTIISGPHLICYYFRPFRPDHKKR